MGMSFLHQVHQVDYINIQGQRAVYLQIESIYIHSEIKGKYEWNAISMPHLYDNLNGIAKYGIPESLWIILNFTHQEWTVYAIWVFLFRTFFGKVTLPK